MPWDPTVLRKYNTTGHFRLINQLRAELKERPLVRPRQGETVGDANRSKSLTRLLEGRQGGAVRSRRSAVAAAAAALLPVLASPGQEAGGTAGFRERLNAIELR